DRPTEPPYDHASTQQEPYTTHQRPLSGRIPSPPCAGRALRVAPGCADRVRRLSPVPAPDVSAAMPIVGYHVRRYDLNGALSRRQHVRLPVSQGACSVGEQREGRGWALENREAPGTLLCPR